MGRKRGHQPPRQGFAGHGQGQVPVEVPVIQDPQQREAAAQAQMKARVEQLAAQIFVEKVSIFHDKSQDELTEHYDKCAERSIDAALILAKHLWGIEAQRTKPPARPKRPPRVITDDDFQEEEEVAAQES